MAKTRNGRYQDSAGGKQVVTARDTQALLVLIPLCLLILGVFSLQKVSRCVQICAHFMYFFHSSFLKNMASYMR